MNVQDTGYNQDFDRQPTIKPEFNPSFMEQQYPVRLLFNAENQNQWDEQHASNPKMRRKLHVQKPKSNNRLPYDL